MNLRIHGLSLIHQWAQSYIRRPGTISLQILNGTLTKRDGLTELYFTWMKLGRKNSKAVIQLIKNNHPGWKIGMAGFHTPSDFVNSNVYDLSLMVGTEDSGQEHGIQKAINFLLQL